MLTLNKRHAFPKNMYLSCGLSFRLRSRLNLSPVSNKRCKAVPILLIFFIVRLVISPVFVSIRIQLSSVRPHPVTFVVRIRKSNPVTTVFVGRQKLRFYEIIFFTRFNLYQSGIPFFAFLIRVFPSFI